MNGARNDCDPGLGGCTGYPAAGKDLAYILDLAMNDVVDLSCRGRDYDGSFYIVTDCSDVVGTCIIGADQTINGQPETIHWVVPAAGIYYLILDAYGSGAGGSWILDYDLSCPPPPVPTAKSSWGRIKRRF